MSLCYTFQLHRFHGLMLDHYDFLTPESDAAASLIGAVLANIDDAIYIVKEDNLVEFWSQGAERVYGYTSEEIVGQSVTMLCPKNLCEEAVELVKRAKHGEHIERYQTSRVTKDGRRIRVQLMLSPIVPKGDEPIRRIITIARDVSPQKQAEDDLRQMEVRAGNRAVVLETANQVALDILASRTGVAALKHIADAARMLAGARYAALGVARQNGSGLQEFVTVGLRADEEAAIGPRPTGHGVLGLLLKRSEPLRIDALNQHEASFGFPPNHPPMDSFLGVPIRRGDIVVGSLYLTNKEGAESFTEADEAAVQALGAHAAVAIHNLHMLSQQRALVSSLITAQEEERRAVAFDLHDGLTQYVMASHAHLESFKRAHVNANPEKAQRELEQGLRYLKDAIVESRRLVNGLRTLALDDLGLAGAIEQLLTEEKDRAEWQDAELAHNIAGKRFDKTLETAAYRIVQEALTNVRKHAETDRARILMLFNRVGTKYELTLEVRDWGRGFAPSKTSDYGHFGLQSMAERVHLIGGEFHLTSAPGDGTVVRAVFPVDIDSEPGA